MRLLAAAAGATGLQLIKTGLLPIVKGLARSGYGNAKILIAPANWSGAPSAPTPKIWVDRPVIWWPEASYQALRAAWMAAAESKMEFVPFFMDQAVEPGRALYTIFDPLKQKASIDAALPAAPSVNTIKTATEQMIQLIEGTPLSVTVARFAKKAVWVAVIGGGVYYAHTRGWFSALHRKIVYKSVPRT